MTNEDDVMVVQTANPVELKLARNLFKAAGIPHRVESVSAGSGLTAILGTSIAGPSAIFVPAEAEERALAILAEAWGEPEEESGEAPQV